MGDDSAVESKKLLKMTRLVKLKGEREMVNVSLKSSFPVERFVI